jgi:hypothetical protein
MPRGPDVTTSCWPADHGRQLGAGAPTDDVPVPFLVAPLRVSGWPRDQLKQVLTDAGFAIEMENVRSVSAANTRSAAGDKSSCSLDAPEPSAKLLASCMFRERGSMQPASTFYSLVSAGWRVNQIASSRFGTQHSQAIAAYAVSKEKSTIPNAASPS